MFSDIAFLQWVGKYKTDATFGHLFHFFSEGYHRYLSLCERLSVSQSVCQFVSALFSSKLTLGHFEIM